VRKHAHKPTYSSWTNMKNRCLNPNHAAYPLYAGRGIRICERWLHSFDNFLADMGERPPGKTLDRVNNDGHYEQGNCRWATWVEQIRNRTHFKPRIDFTGRTFGRLTVISRSRVEHGKVYWQCVCSCGAERVVCYSNLAYGHTSSCGCARTRKAA
jgi:hypothetical protein